MEIGNYISVTLDPEQVIPFHDSPHGSPPLELHLVSCHGEFRLLYLTLRAEAVHQTCHRVKSAMFSKGQESMEISQNNT